MIELPWIEPFEAPVPPDQVRIHSIEIVPYPDRRRIQVSLSITPFLEPPDIDILAKDDRGNEMASASIIASTNHVLTFTLHLRDRSSTRNYAVEVSLRYQGEGLVHQEEVAFRLPEASAVERD